MSERARFRPPSAVRRFWIRRRSRSSPRTTRRIVHRPDLPPLHSAEDDRQFIERRVLAETEVWVAELDGGSPGGAFMALHGDHLQPPRSIDAGPRSRGASRSATLLRTGDGRFDPTGFKLVGVRGRTSVPGGSTSARGLTVVELTQGEA